MIGKLVVGAVALACLSASPPLPASTESGISPTAHPSVLRVDCMTGRGTAFYVSEHIMLSVAHVTNGAACYIGNKPFRVLEKRGDFTVVRPGATSPKWLRIDCGGFIAGRHYVAVGHARGLPTLTTVDLVATGEREGEWSILRGVFTVQPGQSGGPVIDAETGKVVGTVNVYDARQGLSGSVALKDSPICQS